VPSLPATDNPSRLLFESPLVTVGDFRCPIGHPRFADSGPTRRYCFVFPRRAVWIQHDGSRPFVADSNVVPLYNAGHPYMRREISADGDRTDWFSVSSAVLREMLEPRDHLAAAADRRLFRFDFARVTPGMFLAQRQVVMHLRVQDPPDAMYVEESVVAILDAVLSGLYGCGDVRMSSKHRDLAEGAKALINLSFTETYGLTALARSVGSSPFHLCRVFRQHSGLTIHQYRSELRLRRSLELLDESGDDILTTAMTLGYSAHSHFTGAFHRAFGVTPSQFRRLSRGMRSSCQTVIQARTAPDARDRF
jgi:AraC-like DNA-binding protein